MGRVSAPRQQPRAPEVDPDSGEGREIGMSVRMQGGPSPIPGGAVHVTNAQVHRQKTPAPDALPEVKPINAHGVPPGSATTRDRADMERGTNGHNPPAPHYTPSGKPMPPPVPVIIVEQGDAGGSYRSSAPHSFLVPANTSDAVRLCGRDQSRKYLYILNEDATHSARFAQRHSDLVQEDNSNKTIGGALLPAAMGSYLRLATQDELWIISTDTNTPRVSVIQEFDQAG
jgi:hypothetical protein